MRIIFDYKIFFQQKYGGPARYFAELFESLNKIENNTFIVSPAYINEYLQQSNFSTNIIGNKVKLKKFIGPFLDLYNKVLSKKAYLKLKPDIIHTSYYDKYLVSNNKPLVLTVHDLIHEVYQNEYGLDLSSKKKMIERADHIICVSKSTQNDLLKYYNIDKKKISVIYHGKPKIKPIEFQGSFPQMNKPFFLYLGSRKRYKNFRLFLEAYVMNQNIAKDFDIVCFGGGNFLNEERELFKSLKIKNEQIKNYLGDDRFLSYLYKNATAFIYPSLYEGFGMPILEAMNLNCPVISSNTSSMPEVYGNAALAFDPTKKDELADCLKAIVFDTDLRKNLIDKGKARASLFSWDKCARETKSIYSKLL